MVAVGEMISDVGQMLPGRGGLDTDRAKICTEDEVEPDCARRFQAGDYGVAQLRLAQRETDEERNRHAMALIGRLQGIPDEGNAIGVHAHAADNAGMAVHHGAQLAVSRSDAQED